MADRRDTRWVAAEFDRRAATYEASTVHRWQADQAARFLGAHQGRVLDVAPGTGLVARAVAELCPAHVIGIDVSAGMLQVAADYGSNNCDYVQADAARLPFAGGVFEAVTCVAAIPYLPDLRSAVGQWRSVTRPGGTLVFTTPAADGITVTRLIRQAAARYDLDVPDPHLDLGSPRRIVQRAEQLGLTVDVVERRSCPEPLGDDPRAAFDTVLDYGFAEPLRAAALQLREAIYASYRDRHLADARAGRGEHIVLFTRARFAP